jgi:S-DNA-T family DNA segregation ATPase FtsK/SpoIIIE
MRRERLWERRPADDDFLHARVGHGPVAHALRPRLDLGHNPVAEYEQRLVDEAEELVQRWTSVTGLPVAIDPRGGVVSIVGPAQRGRATARAVLLQLICAHAPSDLRLVVASRNAGEADWDWVKWVPHAWRRPTNEGGPPSAALTISDDALARMLEEDVAPRIEQLRTLIKASATPERHELDAPWLVLVLDAFGPADPRSRLPLVREVLTHGRDLRVAVVTLVDDSGDEPAEASVRIRIAERGPAAVEETGLGGRVQQGVELDLPTPGGAEAVARALAPLRLEDPLVSARSVVGDGLLGLLGLPDVASVNPDAEWARRPRSLTLRATLGVTDAGDILELDLKQAAEGGMGPHGLIIGATGSGKSELLRTLVASLSITHSPEDLAFVFVDYKGGAALAEYEGLPHTAGVITNLQRDMRLVDRMHDALHGEQQRRQALLRDAGNLDDVVQYRRRRESDPTLPPLPDLLVVIDEFGELLAQRPDFIDLFVAIGRVGRSLGIHLLFSSQRFDEGRWRGLESHLRYRICLRTNTSVESKAVLGTTDAYTLPPDPGLAYLTVDTGVYVRFRSVLVTNESPADRGTPSEAVARFDPLTSPAARPSLSASPTTEPGAVRTLVERLAAARDVQRAHQVWLPPLEPAITLDSLSHKPVTLSASIGVVDVPLEQRTEPLVVDFSGEAGHLAVVGAPQSGKSTLLRTLLLAMGRAHSPRDVQFWAIDLGGGLLGALRELPHVGAVAGRGDRELARRIVARAKAEIEDREAIFRRLGIDSMAECRSRRAIGDESATLPDLFVVVDGWAQLRRDFQDLDFDLEEIAGTGLGYGVHLVVTATRWPELRPSLSDNIGARVELRLNDPLESLVDRRRAEALPSDMPGRGLTAAGLEFQTVLPRVDGEPTVEGLADAVADAARDLAGCWPNEHAPRLRVLPTCLPREEVPADVEVAGIPIGVDEDRLDPVCVDLKGADPHLLVLGDGESGRTNLLRTFVLGLAEQESPQDVRVVLIDPRRTLGDLTELEHVEVYAQTSALAAKAADQLAATVRKRLETRGVGPAASWSGPRLFLVVDDYDVLPVTEGNPLAPLGGLLGQGRDAGFHLVLSRRVAGTTRAAFEPFFHMLKELRGPGLILSGDPAEGPVLDGQRAMALPPGRAIYMRRGTRPMLIQTLWSEVAEAPAVQG